MYPSFQSRPTLSSLVLYLYLEYFSFTSFYIGALYGKLQSTFFFYFMEKESFNYENYLID